MSERCRHGRTARGFTLIEFEDRYGKPCSLQDSSLASEEAIWLGRSEARMHLTREQAEWLIERLQHFVDEGCLPAPPQEAE